ncbi:uncharacterized protein LOC141601023 [Silene latifolia]|uniref:uncharacterized protein LOC141601023 n=1 Tax=Silene latifolia TaxID=37657 RepID=UPI003D77C7C9
MGSIGFWNVRDMNSVHKQKDIRWFLHNNNTGIFRLLETRVRNSSSNKVHHGLRLQWAMVNNITCHEGDCIWIVWDANNYNVEILSCEAQVINTKVTFYPTGVVWWMSVVYGFNRVAERIPLWLSFQQIHTVVNGPWVVMGDFNNVLAMNERIGYVVTNAEMSDFQACVDNCGLGDILAHGAFFTWNNKHEVEDMVLNRIDRAMINDEWLLQFHETSTVFHPEGLYDHCPCSMTLWPNVLRRKGNFKYFNM